MLILEHPNTNMVCLLNCLIMAFTDLLSISTTDYVVNYADLAARDIKVVGVLVEVDEQGWAQSLEPPNVG